MRHRGTEIKWILKLEINSTGMESVEEGYCSKGRRQRWRSKEIFCRQSLLLCSLLIWMGSCGMGYSHAQSVDAHRVAKRVVGTYSPFPQPRISGPLLPMEDNKIETSASLDGSKLNLSGLPSTRNPSQIFFRDSNFRFPTESSFPDRTRLGRTLSDKEDPKETMETSPSTPSVVQVDVHELSSGDSESSRKASPDVQDIIDGIVKLLGGRVHNTQTQSSQSPAVIPQQIQQQVQQQQQQSQSQRPYNLFNPNKPIYYNTPTAKPTRINNRGPPLPTQLTHGLPNQNFQPQSTFEAIPLEALNTGFNLTQTKFGPPFSLTKVVPGPEAPYKHGIPLPEQLVPFPNTQNKDRDRHPPGSESFNNNNFNLNNNRPDKTNGSPPFNTPGENYSNNRQKLGPGNSNGEKVTAPPPFLWSTSNSPHPHTQIYPEYIAPTQNPTTTTDSHRKNPGTIVNFVNSSEERNGAPVPSSQKTSPTTLLVPVTTSAIPTGNKSAIKSQLGTDDNDSLEDDEVDEENEDKKILEHIQNPNVTIAEILEPTMTDNPHHEQPTFVFESSTHENRPDLTDTFTATKTVIEFSPISTKSETFTITTESNSVKINPTTATSILSTATDGGSSMMTNNWGFNFPPPPQSPTSTSNSPFYQPIPSRVPAEIVPNGMTRPTPALRPGIVIHEGSPSPTPPVIGQPGANSGYGSVEVVSADSGTGGGKVGETFDITVTAKQNYGGQVTGQPFVIPVDLKDEIITAPDGNQQFVSIDGKRTYFNLHPSTTSPIGIGGGSTKTVAQLPVISSSPPSPSHPGIVGAPTHPFAKPVINTKNTNVPSRAVSTSLAISSTSGASKQSGSSSINIQPGGSKTPPNLIRRPPTRRPAVQSVRIDTCIVGDDSTCNSEQFESCRTESGVSSCLCRAGYARRRHREPCKAIVSLVLSIRLDKLGDKKLSYNADYFNQNSEIYQSLEWETIHGLDSIMSDTTLQHAYVGAKLDAVGFDGRHAVVNSTVLIQENPKTPVNQLTRDLQRQIVQVLTKTRNNFGKSQLWVETPSSSISSISDVNECENPDLHDCDSKANCLNNFGSFDCKCDYGYGDPFENIPRKSGRTCETCNGKTHCNSRGECQIDDGQKVCKCAGNYYGSQCEIDGEVLAVAIGASVSALVIIGLTLACLCMWSRRWKREEQKAALMSRTLFGGMASQALSYLSKNSMNATNPYQQHITLDERLRWAQVADGNMNGNIYVQNEPLSMHANPGLLGPSSMMETPPMMSARRSADTCDTTVDDLFEERHPTKRPKSRSSQMQSGIYYDLEPEPQSEIYGTRAPTILSYPAQFCVPMNPYPHSRGFYN